MTYLRRLILSLALSACLTPALAQVPPPVPALPDVERRTSYSISASTCGCAVGFALYGDSTDYANWIEVFVNGARVPQSGNWTISSPTGSLATIPRPISDAVLNFTTVQTGTVQIVGARRPRRTTQFQEGQPVPTRNFNQTFSDIIATQRELWDKTNDVTGRAVLAPPGETLALLPVLATRRSQGACFDASGNLVNCVSIPSSTFSAGNGITFTGVGPTVVAANLTAGAGISITGTNPLTIAATSSSTVLYNRPQDFGAACDGVTNDAVALQNMLTTSAAAGKAIFIPPGPDCLTGSTLTVPSNTTMIGADRQHSVIRGTGVNLAVFSLTNVINVVFKDFWCKGSRQNTSWTVSRIGCITYTQNGSAVVAATGIVIKGMKFSNFNATYWNIFSFGAGTLGMSGFIFEDNYILSAPADIPTDVTPTNDTNFGLALFSGGGGVGRIENTTIKNNVIEANAICFAIGVFSNTYKTQVIGNTILNAGQSTPHHCDNADASTINSYGIVIYDQFGDGNPPTNFIVAHNTIISPYGIGAYLVGDGTVGHTTAVYNSSRSIVANNLITGQTSQDDVQIPRAAIVISALTDLSVTGNYLQDGFGGVAAVGQQTGVINIESNTCVSSVAPGATTPSCVQLGSGANGSSNTSKHIVKGNYLELVATAATSSVIRLGSSTSTRFGEVEIADNTINAGYQGLAAGSQFVTGPFTVRNNKFGGPSSNFMMSVGSLTGPVSIMNNVFDSSGGVNGNGLVAASAFINMTGNKFQNRASGAVPMFTAVGACGTIQGTQFNSVVQPAQVGAGSLGTTNPSGCSLNYQDFVQDLAPVAGAGTILGWLHASTTTSTTHQALALP